jgi:hypothetical protein
LSHSISPDLEKFRYHNSSLLRCIFPYLIF